MELKNGLKFEKFHNDVSRRRRVRALNFHVSYRCLVVNRAWIGDKLSEILRNERNETK